jgi:hypothetical protein
MLTPDTALAWTARLVGLAVSLQTIELLQIRHVFAENGVWRWSTLAREQRLLPAILRWPLAGLLPYRPFLGVLGVRLGAGLLVLATGWLGPSPLLLITTLLVCVRFRGTFNGGSDAMTVVILLALSVAAAGQGRRSVAIVCLGYVAVQATLSYLIAGIAKLKESQWRNGSALRRLFDSTQYVIPDLVRRCLARPAPCAVACWLVIAFECSFPLLWLGTQLCLSILVCGALFHLSNAAVLGLNRFFFAWLASYPALLYFSQLGVL